MEPAERYVVVRVDTACVCSISTYIGNRWGNESTSTRNGTREIRYVTLRPESCKVSSWSSLSIRVERLVSSFFHFDSSLLVNELRYVVFRLRWLLFRY